MVVPEERAPGFWHPVRPAGRFCGQRQFCSQSVTLVTASRAGDVRRPQHRGLLSTRAHTNRLPALAVASGLLWFASPGSDGYALTLAFGLGATFFTGATINAYGLLPRITNVVVLSAAGVLVLGAFLSVELSRPILWVSLPIVVLGLGSRGSRLGAAVAHRGDISYGVYLWAFPIQQVLVGTGGFFASMALTLVLTTLAGLLSMRLIERPALALRPRRAPEGGQESSTEAPSYVA